MLFRLKQSHYVIALSLILASVWVIALGNWVAAADLSHEMGKVKTKELHETSGMVASRKNPNILWLHNDGPSQKLFALSTEGKLAALLSFDAVVADAEDIAIGPGPQKDEDYIYLGDIGDNSGRRQEVRIIRFAEPKLSDKRGEQLQVRDAEVLRLTYPDGPHDAETLLIDPIGRELIVVTKERHGARMYSVPLDSLGGSRPAKLAAAGESAAQEVSAGAVSPDGSQIILRREKEGWRWRRQPGQTVAEALTLQPEEIPVQGKRQGPNGESITFGAAGNHYFTISEGKKQAIYRFDLPANSASGR